MPERSPSTDEAFRRHFIEGLRSRCYGRQVIEDHPDYVDHSVTRPVPKMVENEAIGRMHKLGLSRYIV